MYQSPLTHLASIRELNNVNIIVAFRCIRTHQCYDLAHYIENNFQCKECGFQCKEVEPYLLETFSFDTILERCYKDILYMLLYNEFRYRSDTHMFNMKYDTLQYLSTITECKDGEIINLMHSFCSILTYDDDISLILFIMKLIEKMEPSLVKRKEHILTHCLNYIKTINSTAKEQIDEYLYANCTKPNIMHIALSLFNDTILINSISSRYGYTAIQSALTNYGDKLLIQKWLSSTNNHERIDEEQQPRKSRRLSYL